MRSSQTSVLNLIVPQLAADKGLLLSPLRSLVWLFEEIKRSDSDPAVQNHCDHFKIYFKV